MKKILLSMALIFVAIVAAEETGAAPKPSMETKYGVRAGTNLSSFSGFRESVLGWQIGGAVDMPIKQIEMGRKWGLVNIASEPMVVSKSGKYSFSDWSIIAYYLEVPIYGSFKFLVSPSFSVRADVGPYFAIGLFGSDSNDDDKSAFDHLSRFDIGVHYGVAIGFLQDFYFALKLSQGYTKDNVYAFYQTLGYNF